MKPNRCLFCDRPCDKRSTAVVELSTGKRLHVGCSQKMIMELCNGVTTQPQRRGFFRPKTADVAVFAEAVGA